MNAEFRDHIAASIRIEDAAADWITVLAGLRNRTMRRLLEHLALAYGAASGARLLKS